MAGDQVWITHPQLGSVHDQKVPRSALGTKVLQGWAERADQSDPVEVFASADPRPGRDSLESLEVPATSGSSKSPSPLPRKES